eukprot:NODE_34_length_36538_cov_0.612854.p12 type:complete len:315 gc:universal NODE_34_length_36538_cov_0.612854:20779-21723(+)
MDYALGAFVGVMVGDAAGATLEFMSGLRSEEEVDNAMKMPGGGVMKMGPGQITDDSELSLCLAYGLQKGFEIDAIAKNYHEWYKSCPPDIGNTCRNAFSSKNSAKMYRKSKDLNGNSQANGALMRLVPLAIFTRNMSENVIVEKAKMDCELSHPNPITVDCNCVYSLALAYLLKNSGDSKGCISYIEKCFLKYKFNAEVYQWFKSSTTDNEIDCLTNIGHVKHAFMLSFYCLRKHLSYEAAIKDVLKRGGDTDTNAAICGGILGCLHGIQSIPDFMKSPVLSFDSSKNSWYKRPKKYNASNYESLITSIYNKTL